jgi:hypothetical protein
MSAAGSGVGYFKHRILDFDQVEMRFVPLIVKQPQAFAIRNRNEGAVIQDHVFLQGRISRTTPAQSDHFTAVAGQVSPDRLASL